MKLVSGKYGIEFYRGNGGVWMTREQLSKLCTKQKDLELFLATVDYDNDFYDIGFITDFLNSLNDVNKCRWEYLAFFYEL